MHRASGHFHSYLYWKIFYYFHWEWKRTRFFLEDQRPFKEVKKNIAFPSFFPFSRASICTHTFHVKCLQCDSDKRRNGVSNESFETLVVPRWSALRAEALSPSRCVCVSPPHWPDFPPTSNTLIPSLVLSILSVFNFHFNYLSIRFFLVSFSPHHHPFAIVPLPHSHLFFHCVILSLYCGVCAVVSSPFLTGVLSHPHLLEFSLSFDLSPFRR